MRCNAHTMWWIEALSLSNGLLVWKYHVSWSLSYIWLMTWIGLYTFPFCLFPVNLHAYIITLQPFLWINLWALVLYGSCRFSWWSIWMWRTAGALRSHQHNSHTPARAASLLHFLPKRNHRGRSSHSSSKGQFIPIHVSSTAPLFW